MSPDWKSKYFSWSEVTASQYATRNNISNEPPAALNSGIVKAARFLDDVREILGTPILVSSWYRSPEINEAIGGARTSAHQSGFAIDFTSPQFGDPSHIFEALRGRKDLVWDQLILEYNSWVHISFAPTMRGDVLIYNGKSYRRV